ncbi:hypothetical protein MMC21_006067 [Puttea exsequens]|nr:hypothetical protein [Puttea exsequens]
MVALDNGALTNLLTIGQTLPQLARSVSFYRSIQAVFDAGRAIVALAAISDDVLWTLAELFLILFSGYSEHQISIASTNTLPKTDFEEATRPLSAATASQSGRCPTGNASPACTDDDCLGDPNKAATCIKPNSPKSSCSCAAINTPVIDSFFAPTWLDNQQKIFSSMFALGALPMGVQGAAKPTCLSDGAPWFSPPSWCNCHVATATATGATSTSGQYPAIAGKTGSAACALPTLPSKAITPRQASAAPTNIPGVNNLPGCAYVSPVIESLAIPNFDLIIAC